MKLECDDRRIIGQSPEDFARQVEAVAVAICQHGGIAVSSFHEEALFTDDLSGMDDADMAGDAILVLERHLELA